MSPSSRTSTRSDEQLLELGLHAVLLEPGILPELVAGLGVDLVKRDREPLPFRVGDDPAVVFLDERVGGVHPIERLVGATVGVDGHAPIGLHHDEPGRLRQVGGEPPLVVDTAVGDDNAHWPERSGGLSNRSGFDDGREASGGNVIEVARYGQLPRHDRVRSQPLDVGADRLGGSAMAYVSTTAAVPKWSVTVAATSGSANRAMPQAVCSMMTSSIDGVAPPAMAMSCQSIATSRRNRLGDPGTGVAKDEGVAELEAGEVGRIEAGIHAGENQG